jgi:RND family efflux transporter MFP subunit
MRSIGLYEVELAQSAVNKAEAELEIARLNTERCTIKAPYDGRVAKVYVNEHESIERQQPLIEIIGSGILEAQLLVSSKWLSWLVKDYPIQILVDETKESYDATIESIGANIDPVSQTIDITAKFLENYDSLLPGMSGTASF